MINASLMAFNSELIERQIKIVKQTKKRLVILIMLIVIYCVTFVPNFITTILKNTLYATSGSLRPFNLIFSILALANPTLNSLVLLTLCLKSDDRYLNAQTDSGTGGASSSSTSGSVDNDDRDDVAKEASLPGTTSNNAENVADLTIKAGSELRASLRRLVNRVLIKRGLDVQKASVVIVSDRAISDCRKPSNRIAHNINTNEVNDSSVPLSELEPCLKNIKPCQEEEV